MKRLNIAVMTTGGSMPPETQIAFFISLMRSLRSAEHVDVWGISGGIVNLVNGLAEVRRVTLDDMLKLDGTRCAPFKTLRSLPKTDDDQRRRSLEILEHQIDGRLDVLIVIGGNGSFGVANRFQRLRPDLRVIVVPKTIDGDLWAPDVCLGHDTVTHWLAETIVGVAGIDTIYSFLQHAATFLVMQGANTGLVACNAVRKAVAQRDGSGLHAVDGLLIPEVVDSPRPLETVVRMLAGRITDAAQARRNGVMLHSALIAAAEGALNLIDPAGQERLGVVYRPDSNHGGIDFRKSVPAWTRLADLVTKELKLPKAGPVRVSIAGDSERALPATPNDKALAERFGAAVAFLAAHRPPEDRAVLALPDLGEFVSFERIVDHVRDGEARVAQVDVKALAPAVRELLILP